MDINSPPNTLGYYVMYLGRSIVNRTLQVLTTINGVRTEIDHVVLDPATGAILIYVPIADAGVYAYGVYDKKSKVLYKNGNLIIDSGLTPIVSKTATYELTVSDINKIIECNGTFTVTIPTGLSDGYEVTIVNIGTGTITIASDGTLRSKDSKVTLASQYVSATIYHSSDDIHYLIGDLV